MLLCQRGKNLSAMVHKVPKGLLNTDALLFFAPISNAFSKLFIKFVASLSTVLAETFPTFLKNHLSVQFLLYYH